MSLKNNPFPIEIYPFGSDQLDSSDTVKLNIILGNEALDKLEDWGVANPEDFSRLVERAINVDKQLFSGDMPVKRIFVERDIGLGRVSLFELIDNT